DTRLLLFHDKIRANETGQSISTLLDETSFQENNKLEHLICIQTTKKNLDDRFTSWDSFLSGAEAVTDETLQIRWDHSNYPDEIGIIMYTSGSTGKPK